MARVRASPSGPSQCRGRPHGSWRSTTPSSPSSTPTWSASLPPLASTTSARATWRKTAMPSEPAALNTLMETAWKGYEIQYSSLPKLLGSPKHRFMQSLHEILRTPPAFFQQGDALCCLISSFGVVFHAFYRLNELLFLSFLPSAAFSPTFYYQPFVCLTMMTCAMCRTIEELTKHPVLKEMVAQGCSRVMKTPILTLDFLEFSSVFSTHT